MYHQDDLFLEAVEEVLRREGGYVDDSLDKGGETKYGISKRSYPRLDIKNLTLEEAKKIYYRDYWVKNKCNVIFNYWLSSKLFDMSVNMGCKQAGIILQRSLRSVLGIKLSEDGIIGPQTLDAVRRGLPEQVLVALRSEAAGYYRSIVASDKSQQRFLTGWLNRAYA